VSRLSNADVGESYVALLGGTFGAAFVGFVVGFLPIVFVVGGGKDLLVRVVSYPRLKSWASSSILCERGRRRVLVVEHSGRGSGGHRFARPPTGTVTGRQIGSNVAVGRSPGVQIARRRLVQPRSAGSPFRNSLSNAVA
jgi:hypothetical protein